MLLGIDASRATRTEKTGVEWYAWNIIQAMAREMPEGWRVRMYSEGPITDLPDRWKSRPLPWPPRILWSQIRLGVELLTRPLDVFFVPAHVLPFVHSSRSVVTIHDIAFRTLPKAYNRKSRWYLDLTTRFAMSHATRIIVPSEAVARDLHEYYGAPESRVWVIPHGPGIVSAEHPRPTSDSTHGHIRTNMAGEVYFVAIGRIETKKNTARIVEAYARAREKSDAVRGMKLVIVGGRGVGAEETDRAIARSGMSEHIIRTGHLPADEVCALLANARALIFPSLAEGFGMPIVDAMALGVPVITSRGGATEEVAGDAGYLVDPKNIDEIAAGMSRLSEDETFRDVLISKGRTRAAQFSWEKAARETWKVIIESSDRS